MFGFTRKLFSVHKKPGRKTTSKPQFEALESRELMSVSPVISQIVPLTTQMTSIAYAPPTPPPPTAAGLALINGLPDTPVRSTALADYQRDGSITRNDMIDIFFHGTTGFTDLTNSELSSLQTLVNRGPDVAMLDYVQNLSSKVLAGVYSSGLSPAQTIQQNVNNFFLGQKHPDAGGYGYVQVNEPLWNGNPSPKDVQQTSYSPDNWLLTSLEEVVSRNRVAIEIMFIDNGDKTYTLSFYHGSTPDYVTVDNFLPNSGAEAFGNSGVLWVPLLLKAYAQENGAGWLGSLQPGVNSYAALGLLNGAHGGDGGDPAWAFSAIMGLPVAPSTRVDPGSGGFNMDPGGGGFNDIYDAFQSGHFVVLKTLDNANLVGTMGADPLFYPEDVAAFNSQGIMPHPRWYALVNCAPSWAGLFTVTENGTRFLQVDGSVLADNFDRYEQTSVDATFLWQNQAPPTAQFRPSHYLAAPQTLTSSLPIGHDSMPANLTGLANVFTHSAESYGNFITVAYQRYLGRTPTPSEVNGWVGAMQHGMSDEHLEASFIGSAEYIANHGGNGPAWVKGMYQDLLGRTPMQAEVDGWVQAMANGESPNQVAYGFAASAEREGQRITADYQAFLGRTPAASEVDGWVNAFLHGASNENVIGGFAGSLEYFEDPDKGDSSRIDWIDMAFQDILHRDAQPDEVRTWLGQMV